MSKKNRTRREITRRQKEQRQAKAAAANENVEEAADDAPEDEASTIQRRAGQKREYEKRKRAKARGSQPLAPYFWGGGVIAVVALAVLGGFLLLSGGGDGDGSNGAPSATPDPRIAGLPIDQTITVDSDDDGQNVNPRFIPNAISGNAGDVIEIINPNIGSVPHNLRFAGLDGEYDTADDWLTDPATIFAGDTGRVVVKFDEPGVYPFKCAFHPTQIGTLTLR